MKILFTSTEETINFFTHFTIFIIFTHKTLAKITKVNLTKFTIRYTLIKIFYFSYAIWAKAKTILKQCFMFYTVSIIALLTFKIIWFRIFC